MRLYFHKKITTVHCYKVKYAQQSIRFRIAREREGETETETETEKKKNRFLLHQQKDEMGRKAPTPKNNDKEFLRN